MTVQGMPSLFAFQPTPCAMLPALAVYTPSARRSLGRSAMALSAPRSLNEPIGWRFSSFSQISAGASSTFRRTSGVRIADPAMRPRAARMSSSAGGSIVRMAAPSEFQESAGPRGPGLLVDEPGRRDVLDREAERLEERDLVRRPPSPGAAGQHLADLGDDVGVCNGPFLLGDQEVSGFVQGRLAPVHVETRLDDGRRIELAGMRNA